MTPKQFTKWLEPIAEIYDQSLPDDTWQAIRLKLCEIATPKKNGSDRFSGDVERILDFLNEKTGKRFSVRGGINADLIKSRLKEGATPEDCIRVITLKVREWGNDGDMSKYLRPSTLFGKTRFWQYHGEIAE